MTFVRSLRTLHALFVVFALCACGGGGGGSSVPSGPVPQPSAPPPGSLSFTVGGSSPTIDARRRPGFVPPSVAKVYAQVLKGSANQVIGSGSGDCSQSSQCEITISSLPPGTFTLDVVATNQLFEPISHVQIPVTITSGQTTRVSGTLNGVISRITLALTNPLLANGSPSTAKLLVTAYDNSNEVIMTPGNYDSPIQLDVVPSNSSASATAMQVSETTVNTPSDVITVSYDGSSYQSLSVTSTAFEDGANVTASLTIAPQLLATEYHIPSQSTTLPAMVIGSDGNVWASTYHSIVRATPAGQLSEYCENPGPSWIVAAPDGRVWFGTNQSYAPAPLATYTCASTDGLRAISTSGVQSAIPVSGYSAGQSLLGPALDPAGALWSYDLGAPGGTPSMAGVSTAGAQLGSFPVTVANAPFAGNQNPAAAPDGSFWFTFNPGVVRCTLAAGCDPTVHQVGTLFQPFAITPGASGDMMLSDASDIYDVDANFNVLWHTNKQWDTFFTGTPAAFNGAVWVGAQAAVGGHVRLLRIATNGRDFAFLDLPAMASASAVADGVNGVVLSPDGHLWYTRDDVIGEATLP